MLVFATMFAVGSASAQARGIELAELHRMLPTVSSPPVGLAVGDVDGDGQRDIVVFTYDDGARVLLSVGNGRFTAIPGALTVSRATSYIAAGLADIDGDGDQDLVYVGAPSCFLCAGVIDVFANDGTGHFALLPAAVPQNPTDLKTSLALGDVDGDGDTDFVVGARPANLGGVFPGGGSEVLFLNDGTGHFVASALPADTDSTTSVVLADFDTDGDLDLFEANATDGAIVFGDDKYFSNDGLGVFTRIGSALSFESAYDNAAVALDVDNDGDLDIVTSTLSALRLRRNNGSGVFADAIVGLPQNAAGTHQLIPADIDSNGTLDLVVLVHPNTFNATDSILQLSNNGAAVFTHVAANDRTPLVLGRLMTIAAFDVDGDADTDVVVPHVLHGELFLNDGTGTWNSVPDDMPRSSQASSPGGHVAADIDGDGDLDVLDTNRGRNRVFRNEGAGRFTAVPYGAFTTNTTTGDWPPAGTSLAIGDLDSDSLPDVVVAMNSPLYCSVFHNNGAGSLDLILATMIDVRSVALGDVDNDGDLDVYLGVDGVDRVLRNQGGMSFAEIPGAVGVSTLTSAVALADVDGDGDLDAILASRYQSQHVLRNDGTGVFTDISNALPPHSADSRDLAVADFDGDGDQDIVVANLGGVGGQVNWFYRNNGTGTFVDSSSDLPAGPSMTTTVIAADFDIDGDVDLYESNSYSLFDAPTRVLANDGLGHFSVATVALPDLRGSVQDVVPGDFDADGDIDLMSLTTTTPLLFANLHHQLAWRDLPRIGRPLTLDLLGLPADPFAFVASSAPAAIPLPPFGLLQIDPGSVLLLELGTLDAQGRASRTYQVPTSPAFLGLDAYWQAVQGLVPRLGNLEITTLLAN